MPKTTKPVNQILAALPAREFKYLLARFDRVPLVYEDIIYEPGDKIREVYFPESGIISLLSAVDDQATLEVGIVGSEGMVGLPVFLGVEFSSNRALVQGAGSSFRLSSKDFRLACKELKQLPKLIGPFVHSLFTQISQSAACNRYHPIESRLARWLLMTHDRIRSNEFQITQEFLSNMLGVRREAVNKAARELQRQKAISYHRGSLRIIDRKELQNRSCSCYTTIK